MNINRIRMALYATLLTNWYGLKLKLAPSDAVRKRMRVAYAEKLFAALRIDVVVKGRKNLPRGGRFLLVSNHRSIIDPLVVEIALEHTDIFGLWVSKKELYNSFFFGLFTRNAGSICLDRESRQMGGFFKEIRSAVAAGNSIFLFPEGTRNKAQRDLGEFKEGARIIAVKNRLPILPLYIRTNADRVLKGALQDRPARQKITVEIGELIDYRERSVELETAYRKMFCLGNQARRSEAADLLSAPPRQEKETCLVSV